MMGKTMGRSQLALVSTLTVAMGLLTTLAAVAQTATPVKVRATIEKTTGVWVEGPGFDIKYGGSYEQCADRCLGNSACVMIEYYRPENKCNMYNTVRPLKTGGSSIVGTKKTAPSAAAPPVKP